MYGEHMSWMQSSLGVTSMMFMMLFHIAILVGSVYVIFYLIKLFSKERGNNNSTSKNILEERFARGEINEEEFKRMKAILND